MTGTSNNINLTNSNNTPLYDYGNLSFSGQKTDSKPSNPDFLLPNQGDRFIYSGGDSSRSYEIHQGGVRFLDLPQIGDLKARAERLKSTIEIPQALRTLNLELGKINRKLDPNNRKETLDQRERHVLIRQKGFVEQQIADIRNLQGLTQSIDRLQKDYQTGKINFAEYRAFLILMNDRISLLEKNFSRADSGGNFYEEARNPDSLRRDYDNPDYLQGEDFEGRRELLTSLNPGYREIVESLRGGQIPRRGIPAGPKGLGLLILGIITAKKPPLGPGESVVTSLLQNSLSTPFEQAGVVGIPLEDLLLGFATEGLLAGSEVFISKFIGLLEDFVNLIRIRGDDGIVGIFRDLNRDAGENIIDPQILEQLAANQGAQNAMMNTLTSRAANLPPALEQIKLLTARFKSANPPQPQGEPVNLTPITSQQRPGGGGTR